MPAFLGFAACLAFAFAWVGIAELRHRHRARQAVKPFKDISHVRVLDHARGDHG